MASDDSSSKPKQTMFNLQIGRTINFKWEELKKWETFEEFKTNVFKFFSRLGMNQGTVLIGFSLFGFFSSLCLIYEKYAVFPDAMLDSLDRAAQSAASIGKYPAKWAAKMRSSYSQRTCSVVQKAQAEKEKAAKAALAAETAAYKANLAALFASEGGEAKAEDKAEVEGVAKETGVKRTPWDVETLGLSDTSLGRKKERTTFAAAMKAHAACKGEGDFENAVDTDNFNDVTIETVKKAMTHVDAVYKWLGDFITHSSNSTAKTLFGQFNSGELGNLEQDGIEKAFGYVNQARAFTTLLETELNRAQGDPTDAKLKAEKDRREFIPKPAPDEKHPSPTATFAKLNSLDQQVVNHGGSALDDDTKISFFVEAMMRSKSSVLQRTRYAVRKNIKARKELTFGKSDGALKSLSPDEVLEKAKDMFADLSSKDSAEDTPKDNKGKSKQLWRKWKRTRSNS